MVNIYLTIINPLFIMINLVLAYSAIKLLLVFKGEKTEINWPHISLSVLALATSSSLFAFYYIFAPQSVIHPIAEIVMMMGGLLTF